MPIDPGTYMGEVVDYWWENRDNPPMIVKVRIKTEWGDENVIGKIWFTEKAAGMARAQLRALGVNPDDDSEMDELAVTRLRLAGRQVQVEVDFNEYKGRRTLQVSRFGSVKAPPSPKTMETIKGRLRAAKKTKEVQPDPVVVEATPTAKPKSSPKAIRPYPDTNAEPVDDSDIPF